MIGQRKLEGMPLKEIQTVTKLWLSNSPWVCPCVYPHVHAHMHASHFSHVWFCAPRTVACQGPLSMRFSRQEYWSGLPCTPPGDLSNPRIKPTSLSSPALAGMFFTTSATWEVPIHTYCSLFPPNKYFICFTTFYLCGNSFLQSWRARALSLTTGLVARFGALTTETRPQSLAGNTSPIPRRGRLDEATQDQG